MDLDGSPRRDLTRFEGFDAVVAVEVQEFVTLVETHVFYYASAGWPSDFSLFWGALKRRVINLQGRGGVEMAGTEAAAPLRCGLVGQPRQGLLGHRCIAQRAGEFRYGRQFAQTREQILALLDPFEGRGQH